MIGIRQNSGYERRKKKEEGRPFVVYRLSSIVLRRLILFSVFCFLFSNCYADDINSWFYSGNTYYEAARYDEAIKQYSRILESGLESGNLYYNLGNCYFKKGLLGMALLNYEKARRLMPLDKDLESNYEYASSLIKGGAIVSRKSLPFKILNSLFEKFTIDGLAIMLSALYILVLVSVLSGILFRPFKKRALVFAVLLGLFFIAGFIGLKEKSSLLNKEAIIITEAIDAKFEPMDRATTYFTLYEGMKVEVISSEANWHKIRRPDNKSGWVENSSLAVF